MQKFCISLIALMLILCTACEKQPADHSIHIIPEPMEVVIGDGGFELGESTRIVIDGSEGSRRNAEYLSSVLAAHSDLKLQVVVLDRKQKPAHDIVLKSGRQQSDMGTEAYQLKVMPGSIRIRAASDKGVFYGIQSLLQLLPAEFYSEKSNGGSIRIPETAISDTPRFSYRGMHLDVGRHLFPLSFIKRYIDLLAMYKYNNFHWHLTEDQGWRIEIKKYPKLTEVGAWRDETMVGHGARPPFAYDGTPYGGFYTQEEVKEIVQYAADRYITVIPEIELPGHSLAALAAYPELACNPGPYKVASRWGVFEDIYCSKEESFRFLEGVLTEVIALFPGKYIHIGGDEAPKTRWKQCPDCQRRMAEEGLKDEHELQSYFIQRIEKFINSKGRSIIGWDEILEGGLAPNATVMSWRGEEGGIAAARQGHDAIMTPGGYCYFDHYQADPLTEPLAIGGFTSLKKVYAYEPVPAVLNKEEALHILGAQGNVWTEYMKTPEHVEYMVLPRMAALVEVNWSAAEKKNWKGFQQRIQDHFKRYEAMGFTYSKGSYQVNITAVPDESGKRKLSLETEIPDATIFYTTDGAEPDLSSNRYQEAFYIDGSTTIKAVIIEEGIQMGSPVKQTIRWHQATDIKPVMLSTPSSKYAGGKASVLTDGILGGDTFADGQWLGFNGNDMELELEFPTMTTISNVRLRFFESQAQWIFLPVAWHIEFMDHDGHFHPLGQAGTLELTENDAASIKEVMIAFESVQVKKIKVVVESPQKCPPWHSGSGENAWIFVDEIVVD